MQVISHLVRSGLARCEVKLAAGDVSRLAKRLGKSRTFQVAGFRAGQASMRELLRSQRKLAEQALTDELRQNLNSELRQLMQPAALPPQFKFIRLAPDGSALFSVQWFVQPQAPDPHNKLAGVGAALAGGEPTAPSPGVHGYHDLLPQAVRQLPQLEGLRLGGAARHPLRTKAQGDPAPELPQALLPSLPVASRPPRPAEAAPDPGAAARTPAPQANVPQAVRS